MSTDRNVTVIFSGINPMATSTGIERYNIKDMKIGDRIKAYCVPVGEGDHKDDPYITLDINDALDHIEKYHGKKFGSTVTVTCVYTKKNRTKDEDAADKTYDEGATTYQATMGFYAYKVDKGLLMANVIYRNTTLRILNRQNLYSGDRWRLLGPRELSKYIASDLNGTINPSVNPWGLAAGRDWNWDLYHTFYQEPHNSLVCISWESSGIRFNNNRNDIGLGWPKIDQTNKMNDTKAADRNYASLFLYQYVESENATNIYY